MGPHSAFVLLGCCCLLLESGTSLMIFLSVMPLIKRNFRQGREVVKGDRGKLVCESCVMGIDGTGNVDEAVVIVCRSESITEVQVSRFFLNLAETWTFYGADFLSASGSSPESLVLSRATHNWGGSSKKARCCQGVFFH